MDYRLTLILQNKRLKTCQPRGEKLKSVLREGIRYMVEEKLAQYKIDNLSEKARRLLGLFKEAVKQRVAHDVERVLRSQRAR